MKISTIFFDLGKVLVDFDFTIALEKVVKKSPLEFSALENRIYSDYPLISDYEHGHINSEVFFTEMKSHFQYEGNIEELENIWCDVFTPMTDHIDYARLLAEYYPLAIISNTSDAHIRFLENAYDFFPLFRKRIYSHEIRIMKPNAAIYEHALAEMKADKFESLFIDDREDNILGAAALGWQTIHLRPDVDLKAALQSYELKGI
ncbi:MAG: HAD family phosphatase [Blastochloris sp.]|jgi:2-haloacid dehalogenase|nr:HAD family phosphatase [Blastochloris sp.]